MNTKIYDLLGIGIGPFNLGLAALVEDISHLDCIFIDRETSFNWHLGLLLPTAKMQVPFYADLVTLADPCSRFSYMNYLKSSGKLFRFAINESYFPYRSEFNAYCQWVVAQLGNLQFGLSCTSITYDGRKKIYTVIANNSQTSEQATFHGKHIVIGVGSKPCIPENVSHITDPLVFHSGEYLRRKHAALMHKRITIVGSGQSAAEIFLDLLPHMNDLEALHWVTRSARFTPMDYSKLNLEMSSPDYISYFYSLSPKKKKEVLKEQQYLYRGINFSLINEIYEQLYLLSLDPTNRLPELYTNGELKEINTDQAPNMRLTLQHLQKDTAFDLTTNAVILATGYQTTKPEFLNTIKEQIQWTTDGGYAVNRNYSIDNNNTLFVQNAEQHSHGFNSADLGLGPYRNTVILNTIVGYEHFPFEQAACFQHFGEGYIINPLCDPNTNSK